MMNRESCLQPHLLLWAKSNPYKQLLAHMLDTGYCVKAFLSAPSSSAVLSLLTDQWHCEADRALSFSAYLAALHDIGKAMPQFQRQDETRFAEMKSAGMEDLFPPLYAGSIEHEYFSARILQRIWKKEKQDRKLIRPYSRILSLHHQRIEKSNSRLPIPDDWMVLQDALEAEVRRTFNPLDRLLKPDCMDAVCVLLTGLVILCDWVASSGNPFDQSPEVNENAPYPGGENAVQALKQYGLIGNALPPAVQDFLTMWPEILKPRDIQCISAKLDPYAPLTIIEAPMGEGKTEAALYLAERMRAAWGKRGIYVALPTQATSNQMYSRTQAMLNTIQGGHARLLHSTAFLQREAASIQSVDAPEAERWFSSLRMGLLDENGVGTVDQAMAGVLVSKFSVLRLLGLTNKVLIVDELHAYDAYMSEIIQSLLRWCRVLKIPVILLSATLQNSQREAYTSCFMNNEPLPALSTAYPLITQVDAAGHLSEIKAEATMTSIYTFQPVRLGEDCTSIAHCAVMQIKNGGCLCVLVNTVKKAQDVYRALLEIMDDDTETFLFHARFTMGRRKEIEETCLRKFGKGNESQRPMKAILVATQVVEQSLDLDFDGMLTELAPIDLLLQRAGRVHRHRGRIRPKGMEKPEIQVILPEESATNDLEKRYGHNCFVYAPFLLNNTEHLIENGIRIQVPGDVRFVIAKVYEQVTPENMTVWQERAFNQQLMQANAKGSSYPVPDDEIFFADQSQPEFLRLEVDDGFEPAARASTRLGEPTVRIAFSTPSLLKAAKNKRLTREQQKEIFLSSVSLPMRNISPGFLNVENLYKIEKGALRGCYLSDCCDIIKTETFVLVNDRELGVYWKE
ncbi:MAG: CRISPR-associated helicase Cas3' [Clostridia bacterium]|nr:CRISPR-associated helicase Cas3' [Clostridia bacterium]